MTEPLLIQKLNANLSYLTERQAVLSQNIANIDTPNYQAQDIQKPDFSKMADAAAAGQIAMHTTSGKHMGGTLGGTGHFAATKNKAAAEKKPLGNTVTLEEQMGYISDVGAQHQLTTTLLHKFNALYRSALESHNS